jgi:hypothetical protein
MAKLAGMRPRHLFRIYKYFHFFAELQRRFNNPSLFALKSFKGWVPLQVR